MTRNILGIDVGGSGIKAAVVDIETGDLLSDRHRVATPRPAKPLDMAAAVKGLVETIGYDGPVGCCFPTIVVDGYARSGSNLGKFWTGVSIADTFSAATGLAFSVLNDADAAGVAEMRLGTGKDLSGTVITITIGTGLGSGLFYRGDLIPNLELGHMLHTDGKPIERYASDRARKQNDLTWPEWGERFDYFLQRAARVCSPDHFILGGGVSKKFRKYEDAISVTVPCHVAHFKNNAGIIGAALAAADQ